MSDPFLDFLATPNREMYLNLRETLIHSEAYQPYSDEYQQAAGFCEEGKFAEARQVLQEAMANLLLSPQAHQLLAYALVKLGDEKAAQIEWSIGSACIEGILSTGDGTAENPYLVMRVSDEYDVLEFLEKKLASQSLLQSDDKRLDYVRCTDGSEHYFDITVPYERLGSLFDSE